MKHLRHYLDEPLPEGKLALFTTDYQEFACSKATVVRLQTEGMKLDGKPVTLKIVDDYGPNVMVHYDTFD
jgi:hypothetical protein